ncbi:MAG: DUF3783 domain-containing protein [Clostridia bacterium]|nr:DUF3783 domain-containing protein [Clostridia bacterium]
MNPTILSFNIPAAQAAAVEAAAAQADAVVKVVPQAEYRQSVGALLGVLPRTNEVCLSPFKEPMLIMAGLPRPAMEQFLDMLKAQGVYIPYKAMLTPTNLTWRCDALIEELKKEHEQIKRMREKQ